MSKIVTVGVVLAAALTLVGCEKVESAGRKAARKAGSVVGKGTTEFFSGVGEGIRTVSDGNVSDVLTAIATRKSIRKFDPFRAVEDEKVEKILKAAMCAPSAMDKRPWEFVVVKDKWNPAKIHADRW